ncbi:MAG: hypothetical protein GY906_33500 [bacterium]|nr:hypothetical protein [bacterium]
MDPFTALLRIESACIAVLLATVAAAEHPNSLAVASVTNEVQGSLSTTVFELPQGTVKVYLPSDMRAGDTLSGTVVPTPRGEQETEIQKNLAILNNLEFRLASVSGRVHPENPHQLSWTVPAAAGATIAITALVSDENSTVATDLPLKQETSQPPRDFTMPRVTPAGLPIVVSGPFDGDATSTVISVADQPAVVIAESPRTLVAAPSAEVLGPVRVTINEESSEIQGSTRIIAIALSADKLNLQAGETTTMRCRIMGLADMSRSDVVKVAVTNGSPDVVTLDGGDTQVVEIGPGEAESDGSVTHDFTVRGLKPGGYTVSTELLDETEPEALQSRSARRDEDAGAFPRATIGGFALPLAGSQFTLPSSQVDPHIGQDAVPISTEKDCDPSIQRLMTIIYEFQQLMDATREELLENPLVQEALNYKLMLDVINGDPTAYTAIESLLQGKVDEFAENLNNEVNVKNALKLLHKLLEFILKNDTSLTEVERTALTNLQSTVEEVINTDKAFSEMKGKLEGIINELERMTENPLEYLKAQISEGIKGSIEKMLIKAVGAKAAGAMLNMATDVSNFVDALMTKNDLDTLRHQLNEKKKQLILLAQRDDCYRLDADWNSTVEPYVFFGLGKYSASTATITPILKCWDRNKERFVKCANPGIEIESPNVFGTEATERIPAKADEDPYKVHYELDLRNLKECGSLCYVVLEVAVNFDDPKKEDARFPMWVGAVPAN